MTEKRDNGQRLINATIVGKHFGISANKINSILSDLGWIKKNIKGWVVTELGKRGLRPITGGNSHLTYPIPALHNSQSF